MGCRNFPLCGALAPSITNYDDQYLEKLLPIPDYQTPMLPVFNLATEGEGRVPAISKYIHWAKFYISKAGLIDSPRRGTFVANVRGMRCFSMPSAGDEYERA